MKVGDYVRTIDGIIAKIIDVQENPYKEKTIYVLDKEIYIKDLEMSDEYLMLNPFAKETANKIDTHFGDEKIIIKSSTSIMGLIEYDDILKIIYKGKEYICKVVNIGSIRGVQLTSTLSVGLGIVEAGIKSIVTHEQFESMQYNLESEVN